MHVYPHLVPICGQCKSRKQARSVRRVGEAPSPALGPLPSTVISFSDWTFSLPVFWLSAGESVASLPPFPCCVGQFPPFSSTSEGLCLSIIPPLPFSHQSFGIPSPWSLLCLCFCLLLLPSQLVLSKSCPMEPAKYHSFHGFFPLQILTFPWPLCHLKTFSIPWIPPVPWADLRSTLFIIN